MACASAWQRRPTGASNPLCFPRGQRWARGVLPARSRGKSDSNTSFLSVSSPVRASLAPEYTSPATYLVSTKRATWYPRQGAQTREHRNVACLSRTRAAAPRAAGCGRPAHARTSVQNYVCYVTLFSYMNFWFLLFSFHFYFLLGQLWTRRSPFKNSIDECYFFYVLPFSFFPPEFCVISVFGLACPMFSCCEWRHRILCNWFFITVHRMLFSFPLCCCW